MGNKIALESPEYVSLGKPTDTCTLKFSNGKTANKLTEMRVVRKRNQLSTIRS